MSEHSSFHRTFLPDGPFRQVCGNGHHTSNPSVRPQHNHSAMEAVGAKLFPATKTQGLDDPHDVLRQFVNGKTNRDACHPPSQPGWKAAAPLPLYSPNQKRIHAYRFDGAGLGPTYIVEKEGQHFSGHATPFEQHFSAIGRFVVRNGWLEPVVDNRMNVVGHVGFVSGSDIYLQGGPRPAPDLSESGFGNRRIPEQAHGRPAKHTPHDSMTEMMNRILDEGVPMYVAHRNPDERRWSPAPCGSDIEYRVLTATDGRVIRVLGSNGKGVTNADWWLDAVMIGTGVARLAGGLGGKVIRSLARRASFRLGSTSFNGAASAVADEIASSAAKDFSRRGARYIGESGITRAHYEVFAATARKQGMIAVVRNGKPAAIPLIEAGCPGKIKAFEPFNTNPLTGILTATQEAHIQLAYREGYFVVDEAMVARRALPGVMRDGKPVFEELKITNAFWKLEKGQVIDPKLAKPVVGDYDLMGVFSPSSPGRNISLAASNGERVLNMVGPEMDAFSKEANRGFDIQGILHGAIAFLCPMEVAHFPEESVFSDG